MWNRTLNFLDEDTTQQVSVQAMNCPTYKIYEVPNTAAICLREESPRFQVLIPGVTGSPE